VCEYCGCQALDSVRTLTAEHERVLDLISTARSARRRGDLGTFVDLCAAVAAVLGPHTRVEERGLFPAMAADFPEQMAALVSDHRRIDAVLARAVDGSASGDPQWPDQAQAAFVLLREHIRREEDGVFPAALATLSTAQWDAVDALRIGCPL
jgi:hemerythrin-like domain-containing protein